MFAFVVNSLIFLMVFSNQSEMVICLPSTLDMNKLPIVHVKLTVPPWNRIIEALLPGLSENFKTVSVEVVQCPDLTRPPYNLVAEGLCGNETVIDVGSQSYMTPLADRNKLYDMRDFKQVTGSNPLFVAGAGAGPWPYVGVCSEFIANVKFTRNNVDNHSHFYKVDPETGSAVHGVIKNDTRFAMLGHFFASNGLRGEVLRIECKTRKGPLDFVTSIRNALAKYFGDEIVSLGGVILIENGKVKVHVMKDFSITPIISENDMNNWLNFYEVSPPLVGLGYLVSRDPGLDLRPQHFHLFGDNTSGGHYHYDTEPATIKYTAYLNVAKNLKRIDRP